MQQLQENLINNNLQYKIIFILFLENNQFTGEQINLFKIMVSVIKNLQVNLRYSDIINIQTNHY